VLTDAPLLAAVLESPGDDGPRLVLADWYEERGRLAEAALLRMQAMAWRWANCWPGAALCYVDGGEAFFTTQPLSEQWGDDWNDAPYEHNAGDPYEPCWHNLPKHVNDPGRKITRPGELCRCDICRRDWNEDGTPKWHVVSVYFAGTEYEPPSTGRPNSPYSVEQINAGAVPWLRAPSYAEFPPPTIMAGTTLPAFCAAIERAGGQWHPRAKP
jgi:uncharacterized protein (TIGR02996 family)